MMSDTSYRTQKNYINTSKNGKYFFLNLNRDVEVAELKD